MNNFIELYNEVIRTPSCKSRIAPQLCQAGISCVQSTDSLPLKQDILTRLIELYPDDPSLYYYMGFALKEPFPEKALCFYEKSYEINPNNLENMIDLCDLLIQKKLEIEVLKLNKNGLFGNFLHDWRFKVLYYQCIKEESSIESIEYIHQVLSYLRNNGCKTDKEKEVMVSAHSHLANMYNSLSEHDLAVQSAEKAVKYAKIFHRNNTEFLKASSTYLFLCNFDYVDNDIQKAGCLTANQHLPSSTLFSFHDRKRAPGAKIRIGYLSSDFTNHAVSNFIIPILKYHNREAFDIYLYPNQKQITEQLFDLDLPCTNIVDMKDKDVAQLIYDTKIDILIDLNGHTNNNRLEVFALNPAPIQISYLGYPNTTGLSCFHYRLTDMITDPVDSIQYYSEKLLRLPRCFLLYESYLQDKPNIPRKTKDIIVLGSLNKEGKTNRHVLETWKTILHDCPNTRLLIKLDSAKDYSARLEFYMKHLGVEKDRLLIIRKMDNDGYKKLFSMIDVVLDTFPYSGTTTTCNSLYNSLPVVTMSRPNCHAHNVSTSILTNMGVTDLITTSAEEYITLVKDMVASPERIDGYKRTLHRKFMESMKPEVFMADYEAALRSITPMNI